MTTPHELIACEACPARRSTLPFDLADMIAVRLLPAQFARVVGVSKQSVSKWIRAGKVTLGPDGRLDPVHAIQEVLKNTAPTRLRARIFRQAMQGGDAMRAEIRTLQRRCESLRLELQERDSLHARELAALRAQLAAAGVDADRAVDWALYALRGIVFRQFDALVAAKSNSWEELRGALAQASEDAKRAGAENLAGFRMGQAQHS